MADTPRANSPRVRCEVDFHSPAKTPSTVDDNTLMVKNKVNPVELPNLPARVTPAPYNKSPDSQITAIKTPNKVSLGQPFCRNAAKVRLRKSR
jgi:hypothetical protein